MNILAETPSAIAAGALLATSASAASLAVPIENEPAPSLFVEPPLAGLVAAGVAEGRVLTLTFNSPGK